METTIKFTLYQYCTESSGKMVSIDELWADDMLDRRAEAEMLEEVLNFEADECGRSGKEHAYVL